MARLQHQTRRALELPSPTQCCQVKINSPILVQKSRIPSDNIFLIYFNFVCTILYLYVVDLVCIVQLTRRSRIMNVFKPFSI